MARLRLLTRQMHASLHLRRRWVTWLAVLALAAQIVVPFAHAVAFDAGVGVEYEIICTANGIKQIPVNSDGEPIDPRVVAPCPFCSLTTAPVLFVPMPGTIIVTDHERVRITFARPAAQSQASIWRGTTRPSRAPPLFV